MAYTLKTNLANKSNYGAKRNTSNIKYIVIHYTGNNGDTDENNGKYFHNNIVKASAHYFVDDDSITQSVPDNYIAWAVGGNKYSTAAGLGGAKFYRKCTNANSLSIELCDDVKNGTVYPSAGTIANAVAFTKVMMKKYNIPASNVIRHADVNGKLCPAYWYGSATKDAKWKTEFHNKLTATATKVADNDVKNLQAAINKDLKPNPKLAEDNKLGSKTKAQIKKVIIKKPVVGSNKKYPNIIKFVQGKVGVTKDGCYGKNSLEKVKNYQRKHGLKVDGIVGYNTLMKMIG